MNTNKTLLGLNGGGWTRLLFGFIVSALIATAAWGLAMRDSIAAVETSQEIHESKSAHSSALRNLEKIEDRLRQIELHLAAYNARPKQWEGD